MIRCSLLCFIQWTINWKIKWAQSLNLALGPEILHYAIVSACRSVCLSVCLSVSFLSIFFFCCLLSVVERTSVRVGLWIWNSAMQWAIILYPSNRHGARPCTCSCYLFLAWFRHLMPSKPILLLFLLLLFLAYFPSITSLSPIHLSLLLCLWHLWRMRK